MTRIDFYTNAPSKLQIACSIATKAFRQHMRVVVMASDESAARAVDRLMWSTPAIGFLPHCLIGDRLSAITPVLIAHEENPFPHDDLMINLGQATPPAFSRFHRLIEIVSADDENDKLAARQRFRFYKERGYELAHHDLAQATGRGR